MRKSDKKQPKKAKGPFLSNQGQSDWYEFAFRYIVYLERTQGAGKLRFQDVADKLREAGLTVSVETIKKAKRRNKPYLEALRQLYGAGPPDALLANYDPSLPPSFRRSEVVTEADVALVQAWLDQRDK